MNRSPDVATKAFAAIPVVWAFNVVGIVDLGNALRQAEAIPQLGVTWFIPTFIVPVLLVSHIMIFARLIGRADHALQSDSGSPANAG